MVYCIRKYSAHSKLLCARICASVYSNAHVRVNRRVNICMCLSTYLCVCLFACACVCLYVCACVCIHMNMDEHLPSFLSFSACLSLVILFPSLFSFSFSLCMPVSGLSPSLPLLFFFLSLCVCLWSSSLPPSSLSLSLYAFKGSRASVCTHPHVCMNHNAFSLT